MTIFIIGAVLLGIITGSFLQSSGINIDISQIACLILYFLIFCVGLDLGKNRKIVQDIQQLGTKAFLIPFNVAVGSILGSALFGLFLKLPFNEASAIGAGLGWYSFSSIIIAQTYSVEIAALAFLTNVAREILTIILIPILAKNKNSSLLIAPGGATTMDTTLPLINKYGGRQAAILGFINGFILSLLVVILVPILIKL
ncbi:MAG TPA: lysine exporter LysO family protein [Clostridia bacterium]|nr:lysine exporter LysO family protein [Clostridia bacterium]